MDLVEKNSALPTIALAKAGQKGQVLLVILLVMVVGLTIGLSLSTRSVTDIKISTQLEESSRAFAAAEAGIEAALKGEAAPATPIPIGNAAYIFSTAPTGGTDQPLALGKIGIADTYTVWLAAHTDTGEIDLTDAYGGNSIDVCWQKVEGTIEPAMEISIIYQQGANYQIWRGAYDPSSRSNNFDGTDTIDCGGGFTYGKTVSLPGGTPIALRLRPFYAEASIGIAPQGGNNLPSQGLTITSTGTAGETTRKVEVIESYPSLPAIFDYVLFSGGGISK